MIKQLVSNSGIFAQKLKVFNKEPAPSLYAWARMSHRWKLPDCTRSEKMTVSIIFMVGFTEASRIRKIHPNIWRQKKNTEKKQINKELQNVLVLLRWATLRGTQYNAVIIQRLSIVYLSCACSRKRREVWCRAWATDGQVQRAAPTERGEWNLAQVKI